MKNLRLLSGVLGFVCFAFGLQTAFASNSTLAHFTAYGQSFLIAGAILIAGVLISSAVLESRKER